MRSVRGGAAFAWMAAAGCCLNTPEPIHDGGARPDAGVDAGGPVTCEAQAIFSSPVPVQVTRSVWDFATIAYGGNSPQSFAIATDTIVQIYQGEGGGGFSLGAALDGGETRLVVADIAGGGPLDLVGANNAGVDLILYDDSTLARTTLPSAVPINDVSVADLDGDGSPDIATCTDQGIELFFDDGRQASGFADGVFASHDGCPSLRAIALSDGEPPSLISDSLSGEIDVRIGIGDGGFLSPAILQAGTKVTFTIVAADFNRDGLMDIAVAAGGGIVVWLNTGGGTFGPATVTPVAPDAFIERLVAIDLNGDGFPDLIGAGATSCTESPGFRSPVVFWNDCTGGFSAVGYMDAGLEHPVSVGAIVQTGGATPSILVGDLCANQFDIIPSEAAGSQ